MQSALTKAIATQEEGITETHKARLEAAIERLEAVRGRTSAIDERIEELKKKVMT